MNRWIPLITSGCLLAVALTADGQATRPAEERQPRLRSPQNTDQLIEFVQRAGTRLQNQGEAAVEEFARKPSEWNHGDTYLFIVDAQSGKLLFHGADPSLVGKDQAAITGTEGRPLGQWAQQAFAGGADHVWLFYKWPRPSRPEGVWKATYEIRVRAPSGQEYIIGSGAYDLPADRKLVTEMVDMAAERIRRDGQSALDLIRDPKGPFVYKDTQVFVINTKGEVLADPLYPELQGKNQLDMRSADGKPVQRELIDLIQTKGSGWSGPYAWPRPGGGEPASRMIYIKKVTLGEQTLGIASGFYMDQGRTR